MQPMTARADVRRPGGATAPWRARVAEWDDGAEGWPWARRSTGRVEDSGSMGTATPA